ncbi:MAG: hypothetical protein ACLFP8_04755 [Alphaproteobacteria bacterium]
MFRKVTTLLVCPLCLTACQTLPLQKRTTAPVVVTAPAQGEVLDYVKIIVHHDQRGLEAWWGFFNDPVLNDLVPSAFSMNAADLDKRTPFPIDNITPQTLHEFYENKRVSMVNGIINDYIEYRYIQTQRYLLNDYLIRQKQNLDRAVKGERDTIKRELEILRIKDQDFAGKLKDLSVSLSKTTRLLPEYIEQVLKDNQDIPDYDVTPLMASSASIVMNAIEIDIARTALSYKTRGQVSPQDTKDIVPDVPFNQLFGISESVFVDAQSPWRIEISQARARLDFSSLAGHSGAKEDINAFKQTIDAHMAQIEELLISYSTLKDQYSVLEKAARRATQDESYKTRLAVLKAKYEKAKTITALFKKMGLY